MSTKVILKQEMLDFDYNHIFPTKQKKKKDETYKKSIISIMICRSSSISLVNIPENRLQIISRE